MADQENAPFTASPQVEPSRGPWLGLGLGLVLILSVVAYLIVSSRNSPTRYHVAPKIMDSAPSDPYAAKLEISDIKMSAAENLLGGSSIYVEGKIKNNGDKTVTGANVEVTFRNELKEVVQRENHTLMVVTAREPAVDVAALNVAPLKPSEGKEFQLTFEHISADWNRQYPELRVTSVATK